MHTQSKLKSIQKTMSMGLVAGLALSLYLPATVLAAEEMIPAAKLEDSVISALKYNPRLKVLQNNRQAIEYEKDRAFGGYFPKVDVTLGYGTESHSN